MAKEKLTRESLTAQKDANKIQTKIQELTDNDIEALMGGTSSMKTAAVTAPSAVKLAGSENPLCVCD